MHTPRPLDATASAWMLGLSTLWALQQVSLKAAAPLISPVALVALRSGLAALLLALVLGAAWALQRRAARGAPGWPMPWPAAWMAWKTRWRPSLAVGLLFALEYLLVGEALRLTASAHVVVFLYTAPAFAALGLHLLRPAERLGPVQALGLALAFAGIAGALLADGGAAGPASGLAAHGGPDGAAAMYAAWQALARATGWPLARLGDALALGAGLAWAATTVTLRCTRMAEAPATEALLVQLLAAVVVLGAVAWRTGQTHIEWTAHTLAHLAFQSVVVSFASFLAWFWLLRRYLASRLGVFTFLTPLLGVALGAMLLDERPGPGFLAGGAAVLLGIATVAAGGPASARQPAPVHRQGVAVQVVGRR